MKKVSLISALIFILAGQSIFAKNIKLPPNSCVDYISITSESEINCSYEWHASEGSGSADCPIEFSIKVSGVVDNEQYSADGQAYDGKHTGLLGVVTAGISEVIWQAGIKRSMMLSEAEQDAKNNLRFLKSKMCR